MRSSMISSSQSSYSEGDASDFGFLPDSPKSTEQSENKEEQSENKDESKTTEQNKRVLVIDAGGSTVDMAVLASDPTATAGVVRSYTLRRRLRKPFAQKLKLPQALSSQLKPTSVPWGGDVVNDEIAEQIRHVITTELYELWCELDPLGNAELQIAIESAKREWCADMNKELCVRIPYSLNATIHNHSLSVLKLNLDLNSLVENYSKIYPNRVRISRGQLLFEPAVIRRCFDVPITGLCTALKTSVAERAFGSLTHVYLVGGFAESSLLQAGISRTLREIMPNAKLKTPKNPICSTMRGAVLSSDSLSRVTSRISSLSYGVGVIERWQTKKHGSRNPLKMYGVKCCDHVFKPFITAGSSIGAGQRSKQKLVYNVETTRLGQCELRVYSSTSTTPRFTDEEGCELVAVVTTRLPPSRLKPENREFMVVFTFGLTELQVASIDLETGDCGKTNIDFLTCSKGN